MKDDRNNSDSLSRTVLIVGFSLIALLLFALAYRWASSAPQPRGQAAVAATATIRPTPADLPARKLESDSVLPIPATPTELPVHKTESQSVTPVPATIPATPTELPPPEFSNPPQDAFQQMAADWGVELLVSDMSNTGLWQFPAGTLVHPLAVEAAHGSAYLIDSGRVLEIDLGDSAPPRRLLEPGDEVDGVRVIEPLDLTLMGEHLLVLDRAGDVYAYNLPHGTWRLDRYDRPTEASSGHYFVALSADQVDGQDVPNRALLETNYKFAQLYDRELNRIWRLPELRAVDISYYDGDVFVLQRELHDQVGGINKYRDTSSISAFAPRIQIEEPRQIAATAQGLYVLDQAGRRLMLLDIKSGALLRVVQLPQDKLVSAIAPVEESMNLLLAGQDSLYFLGEPDRLVSIAGAGGSDPENLRLNDPEQLAGLDDFVVPIGGSNITFRDFQMPGAPRHYRLGVHNGLDFYWQPGTKVLAAGDGTIIRADIDYVGPTAADLALWSAETSRLGYTAPEILDNYLGRQIWIEHEQGIVTRYAHLRSIEPGLQPGTAVTRGQAIGEVGNSGSPASLESEFSDAHLHFELWVDDLFLGQYLRPIETRDWIERMFPTNR